MLNHELHPEIALVNMVSDRGSTPLASTIIHGQNRCMSILSSNHAGFEPLKSNFERLEFCRCILTF